MSARCMGGFCAIRDSCASHLAVVRPDDVIHERLCVRGDDGRRRGIADGVPMVLFVGSGWRLSPAEIRAAHRVDARAAADPLAAMGW